jgi:squalene-hopene/tetraprenyl-beta-curcumene cyclase
MRTHRFTLKVFLALPVFLALALFLATAAVATEPVPQYASAGISIPAATVDEPLREKLSVQAALQYLEQGSLAWARERKCVACHTTGTYMQIRPALSPVLGKPAEAMREFFVQELEECYQMGSEQLKSGIRPTQVAYIAQGLAEWDAHLTNTLSDETRSALSLMLQLQSEDGSWGNTDCWPPFESSSYQGATIAALALATAPGYLAEVSEQQSAVVEKLKQYLKTQQPPHDYARTLLLWSASRLPGLMTDQDKQQTIEMLWSHQRRDGGWSIRTFSTPENWGGGNRAQKLRSEPDFKDPPSDGHQTGLVVFVCREAGIPAADERIQRAVKWLKSNQRRSGRWWTRSLNTDKFHFITYSGTFYPLLALHRCDAL